MLKDKVVCLLLAAVRNSPILIAALTPFRDFLVIKSSLIDFSELEWGNEARANLGVGVGRIVEIHYKHPRERGGTWRNPYTPHPRSSTTSKELVDHVRSEYGKHTAISGRSGSHAHHLELPWYTSASKFTQTSGNRHCWYLLSRWWGDNLSAGKEDGSEYPSWRKPTTMSTDCLRLPLGIFARGDLS